MVSARPPVERFWEKVDFNGPLPPDPWIPLSTGCWLWTAALNAYGYGHFGVGTSSRDAPVRAHRFAYEQLVGPIPSDREIDHLCRVRHCVRPEHLDLVTTRTNLLRGRSFAAVNAHKTHCVNGHSLKDQDNVYAWRGRRKCRTCHREADRRYYARKVAVNG